MTHMTHFDIEGNARAHLPSMSKCVMCVVCVTTTPARPARAWVGLIGTRPGEGAVEVPAFCRSAGPSAASWARWAFQPSTTALAAWKRGVGLPPGREEAKDTAIFASIALQHRASPETIRHALRGRDASPSSAVLTLPAAEKASL